MIALKFGSIKKPGPCTPAGTSRKAVISRYAETAYRPGRVTP